VSGAREQTQAARAQAAKPRYRAVLFVCAANTARSVLAEYLLRRELSRRGVDGQISVRSAGVAPYARDGALISLDTRLALRDIGIELPENAASVDLKRHPELLERAELTLTMTEDQAAVLHRVFPCSSAREVFTLRAFAGEDGDIADPYEKGPEHFARCRDEIERLVAKVADRLFT
jgi:protein-tyrosine-phosphatase